VTGAAIDVARDESVLEDAGIPHAEMEKSL
jgi:hypothetical protein